MPDISEFLEFTWYEPVWYFEPAAFPEQTRKMARWMGVAHRVGQAMCFWLLPSTGIPIARTTVQKVLSDDLMTDKVQQEIHALDQGIVCNLKADSVDTFQLHCADLQEEDNLDNDLIQPEASLPNEDNIEADAYDELLLVEPLLERDGELVRAKITGRKRDNQGNLVGNYHSNLLFNTLQSSQMDTSLNIVRTIYQKLSAIM